MNIISYAIGLNSSGGSKEPVLESISITANGTYTPDAGIDGYNSVSVSVPQDGAPTAGELTFTGEELANSGFSGKTSGVLASHFIDKINFNNITSLYKAQFFANANAPIDFSSKTINLVASSFTSGGQVYYYQFEIDGAFSYFGGTKLPNITINHNTPVKAITYGLFSYANYIREIPESYNILDFSEIKTENYGMRNIIKYMNSLRSISPEFMAKMYSSNDRYIYESNFDTLPSIDELVNVPISGGDNEYTSSTLSSYFVRNCSRLKNLTFAKNNGEPFVVKWKSEYLDLATKYIGYAQKRNNSYETTEALILDYNSGITVDKEVKDAATYEALKNDADWYTTDINYSRYNHDSAVATINSLPDTSAYLAANGGTNTIKFRGASGSATDGGAINTLTEEEIAVAVAKGWGVAFV